METVVFDKIARLEGLIGGRRVVVITDENVERQWGGVFEGRDCIVLAAGEESKTFAVMERIIAQLIELRADRQTLIVGIGGGVVCDIAGFAASIFMRGVPFGLVPTTLLAQVDAALGGKNGVNVGGYKNMAGTFGQAEFVLCDTAFLATLPQREVLSGLAEVVKTAIVGDPELFEILERGSWDWIEVVRRAAAVKMGIVSRDRHESGERRVLNLGHTLGHAIEKVTDERVPHGFAVAVGMAHAANMAVERGLLAPSDASRIVALLKKLGLPTTLAEVDVEDTPALHNAMRADKKARGGYIIYALPVSVESGGWRVELVRS